MGVSNNKIFVFAILMMVFSVGFNLMTIQKVEEVRITGKAVVGSGYVSICLNDPPVVIGHDCNFTLEARMDGMLRESYSCTINASDSDNSTISFFVNESYATIGRLDGNLTLAGNISDRPHDDNLTVIVMIADESGCNNNITHYPITFPVESQSGVRLIQNYPEPTTDRLTIREGFTTYHRSLDEYLIDLDGFPLNFSYTYLDWFCYNIQIDIQNESHLAVYTVEPGFNTENTGACRARFNATNPYGFTNQTNIFYITVEPMDDSEDEGGDGGAEGTGSGGSGSGSGSSGLSGRDIPPRDCILRNVDCTNWTECIYQPRDNNDIMFYDMFHDGIMKRSCTWQTNCPGEMAPAQKQVCNYIPTCNDSILNCHELPDNSTWCETGIDCGGPCNPCPTCSDWIQNQKEEGIDCGGPCGTCPTCFDEIKNCIKAEGGGYICEEQIDCGGYCLPCPNCSDQVRNCHRMEDGSVLCEEGIDCGGPCDERCPAIEHTAIPDRLRWLNYVLILLIIIGAFFAFRAIAPRVFEYYERKYMDYVKSMIENARDRFKSHYISYFEHQVESLQSEFDAVTSHQVKGEGDKLLFEGQTTGYNIDRYSVSFDNDYSDILTDNSQMTINYAMYMDNVKHGKRILKEIAKLGIKPNYRVCKRSSATLWDERWEREKEAKYEHVNGKLIARTVEYILSFTPKDQEEAKKIVKVLELYGKGSQKRIEDAWDVPDIRVTGKDDFLDYEKHILNTKSVGGQKLIVLTKDRPLPGYQDSTIWLNPGLAKFIE